MSRTPATRYYAWHEPSGRVVRVVLCLPAEREANGRADLAWVDSIATIDPARHWIDGGEIAVRLAQASTLTGLTLASLPDPCEIVIDGVRYACTGGTAELSFGQPGTHRMRVEAFPYLPAEFEVTT